MNSQIKYDNKELEKLLLKHKNDTAKIKREKVLYEKMNSVISQDFAEDLVDSIIYGDEQE